MKYLLSVFISILIGQSIFAQDTLLYQISFPNVIHHEAEISLTIDNQTASSFKLVMSKTSPGRYAVHDFGKNIYNLKASDSNGDLLDIERLEPDVWKVKDVNDQLTVQYTLFANHPDGTYSGIDAGFANLNMPATLMWVTGMKDNPVKVKFNLPDTSTWKIATQLQILDSADHSFFAPNLQYLMDSPCLLGNLKQKDFQPAGDSTLNIKMFFNANTSDEELEVFKIMTQKVVDESMFVFGEFPEFKNNTYSFLCSYGLGFYGDGMEHRNSTMISSRRSLTDNQQGLIGTISHEFFHVWNIERIRPASLEPFDFTKPNVSQELWFGEGFTSYYGDLILCRAGITPKDRYIHSLSVLINYALNAPGWNYGSPVYMSEMATYVDQSSHGDETNFSNTYLSYYSYGKLIALALDLSLRTQFEGISLDNLMAAMWIKYGKTELPYANKDIENTLSEVCKDDSFAHEFFNDHIYSNTMPDFEILFDKIGYKLIKKNPDRPGLGYVRMKFEGDTATMLSAPLVGSGLYEAGVNKGDLILSIDEQPVTSYPELNFIIGTRKIGDELEIQYAHLGKLKIGIFKLQEENQLLLVPKERFSMRLKEEEESARNNWLSTRQK